MKKWLTAALILILSALNLNADKMILVENGIGKLPVIIDRNAPQETIRAANTLVNYVEKISGAKLNIVVNNSENPPEHAIWIGAQPGIEKIFPNLDFNFQKPEEILIACDGRNIVIAGRDRITEGAQTEFGTANAVYVFLQKYLDVRWLWPGPLGEDIVRQNTVSLAPFEYRFHPQLRMRKIWRGSLGRAADLQIADWFRFQHLELSSAQFNAGHSFTDWWEKYHEAHPEWFALREDGTRTPEKWGKEVTPSAVKLCVSNPEVAEQWLKNAEEYFLKNPSKMTFGATPNDGGGFCTCPRCRAWDNPNGPPVWGYVALTDRYVKFWNILARGLKKRFPGRELYLGAYAYSAYVTPPVSEKLDENIVIAYVGHFPLTTEKARNSQKEAWKEWGKQATMMWYRPNLFYWSGGIWGFPEVAMRKTIEDFRFLADNRCAGLEVDGYRGYWSTQGPEYYVMAQLAYDPFQDGNALLKDYYSRGFGAAADKIEKYWTMMEDARDALCKSSDFKLGSRNRYSLPAVFQEVYTEDFFRRADMLLKDAAAMLADAPEIYMKRVEFVRCGLDYTRLMMKNVALMKKARESKGRDVQAIREVIKNWAGIETLVKNAGIGLNSYRNILTWVCGAGYMGGMQDYFGPPSEALRRATYDKPETPEDARGRE